MTIRLSEIQITKVGEATTPLLLSDDAFDFTTEPTAPEPYNGNLADWQANYGHSGFADGHTGPHCYLKYELSRADGPDTLTSDVTDQSVEVLGQPTETLDIPHTGLLLV